MHVLFVLAGLGALASPIVGGDVDTTDTAVVEVALGSGQCSGVVVAPTVVVTAAHCIAPGSGSVDTGTETIAIVATWVDRGYAGGVDHDLAALRLEHATTIAPVAFAAAQLGAVRLVGFGATSPGGARGIRHAVAVEVSTVTAHHLLAGGAGATTCTGDSGGAALDGNGALVGVVSAGDDQCASASQLARPDTEPDLARVIAAWTTPCDACTPCDFEGTCDPSCAVVDLDCPLGGAPGATCATALDCESRACLPAPDGPDRGAFCTVECVTAVDCPAPLDTCTGGSCVYAGGTPGIAGVACGADATCRSGLCDLVAGVCTVPCGQSDDCPAELACEPVRSQRACTLAADCSVAGGSSFGAIALVIAFVIRRRRH